MFIRRKVFSRINVEGEERLFSVANTDLVEQRTFGRVSEKLHDIAVEGKPYSRQTRLAGQAAGHVEDLEKFVKEVPEKVKNIPGKAKDVAIEAREILKDKADTARYEAGKRINEAKETAVKKGHEAVDKAKKGAEEAINKVKKSAEDAGNSVKAKASKVAQNKNVKRVINFFTHEEEKKALAKAEKTLKGDVEKRLAKAYEGKKLTVAARKAAVDKLLRSNHENAAMAAKNLRNARIKTGAAVAAPIVIGAVAANKHHKKNKNKRQED